MAFSSSAGANILVRSPDLFNRLIDCAIHVHCSMSQVFMRQRLVSLPLVVALCHWHAPGFRLALQLREHHFAILIVLCRQACTLFACQQLSAVV